MGFCVKIFLQMLRLKKGPLDKLRIFLLDFLSFLRLLFLYFQEKVKLASLRFEFTKNLVVQIFLFRRGRYKRPFLHFGMMSILGIGVLVAPALAQTYPLLSESSAALSASAPPSEVLSSISEVTVFETQISPKPRDKVIIYTIQKGDTISTIAEKFSVSTDTIRWANSLTSDSLTIGQELKIPPVTGMMHRVERGDSVYTIAKKYDTDAQKIVNFPFNDFANPETFSLVEGQMLIIPDGVKPKAPVRSPRIAPKFIAKTPVAGESAGFIWPTTGNITQYPVWYHNGVDIANKEGPAVIASKKGRVLSANCDRGGYGCHVIIDHGNGTETLYGHLQKFNVSANDEVSQGETIGQMGSTGRSTGTHLHFEVRQNGTTVNPLNFLK